MSKNIEHLQHIKSNVVTEGKPKLPTAEVLVDGELAVNYAEGYETISLRNSNSGIATFSSDDYYTKKKLGSGFTSVNSANTVTSVIEENEEIITSALNDLDERKLDVSAYTPVDLSNYYTRSETSGSTELSTAFSNKADSSALTAHTSDTNIHLTSEERDKLHTHTNKTYLDSISGTVGTMAYENADSYSSATEVNTAFGIVNASIEDLSGQSETVAAALNDLSNNKLDVSAYTQTDLSNYYTKSETSGATELSTAFVNKANTSDLNLYADAVKYNDTTKYVEFYHGTTGGTKVFEFNAAPFIIDGMVQNVEIKDITSGGSQVTCLVISFNTDAGKQNINIPISDIFDASNYYTKSETSGATELSTAFDTINVSIEDLSGQSETIAAALNDLNAKTSKPTDLSNYYTKDETSGATELQTAFNGKTDTAITTALNNVVTAHTADTNIHLTATEKNQLHTHNNKSTLDAITATSAAINSLTGAVGTMAFQDASSYSSATDVSTALASKTDKSEYATFSAATNTSIKDLSGQSETVAAALNDLNAKKLDATAYTPVDTSSYYKKTETSGASEIQTALDSKVDTTAFTSHTSNTAIHMTTTEKTNLDSLATNIAAISGITATNVNNWENNSHTHSNMEYLSGITGTVGTMAYKDADSYSSATDVSTALAEKADKSVVDDLSKQSETIAAALNDLNARVEDLTSTVAMLTSRIEAMEQGT